MRRYQVVVTTDAAGAAEVLSPTLAAGRLNAIHYVKHGVTPYANGVDFTITMNTLGENIWTESDVNASKICRPRVNTNTQAGVAITDEVSEPIAIASDKVKFVIAQGGDTKTGTFYILVE